MRSDTKLGNGVRDSESWKSDPVSGKSGTDVARYRLSDHGRVTMSLSGKERNHLFLSHGGESYTDISNVSGADSVKDGRSFAILDFDRDGWQDMVLANANGPVLQLFRNQAKELRGGDSTGNFVALRFVGGANNDQPSATFGNRDGVGASVKIEVGDRTLSSDIACGEGFAAQNSSTKLFGLGENSNASSITITWPKGTVQQVLNVKAGELLTFYENPDETEDNSGVVRSQYLKGEPQVLANATKALQNRSFRGMKFDHSDSGSAKLKIYTSVATWCDSCKRHLPEMKQLRSAFAPEVLSMTGVPVDDLDTPEKLEEYVATHRPPYTLSSDWTSAQRFQFFKLATSKTRREILPTTIVTNSEGEVLEIMTGIPTNSDIIRLMPE